VPFAKASRDVDKVAAGPNGVPDEFLLVTGGTVSSDLRDKVRTHAAGKKIEKTEV
jgi:hypothetical protein